MSQLTALFDLIAITPTLGQSAQELIESGQRWQMIGGVLGALAGIIMGLALIFNKDKPDKPTDPRVKLIAQVIGVLVILGSIGFAVYTFVII